MEKFEISIQLPASPEFVYRSWLDSKSHTEFTGGEAEITDVEGDSFSAWDGYISGMNLELEPGTRILQSWRTVEFPEDAPDSHLEVRLSPKDGGTLLTLTHWNLHEGAGAKYEQGWKENYFEPMLPWFENNTK